MGFDNIIKLFSKVYILVCKINLFVIKNKFENIGQKTFIECGFKIEFPEYISIGTNTYISKDAWISMIADYKPKLEIGDNVYIGRYLTLSCVGKININNNVMISDRCYIGDAVHGFNIKNKPIKEQLIYSAGNITIGENSWIGIGVSILPGVVIGKHCVIGANSVVTKNIPDYHIAAGNPAKIIRKIDFD